ncbi:MAG: glycoside hydrolase family 127 protein [Bacteroidales bacterium]|nr:MAG: glycoside hydrolase family 127 protein [Bacteroidales bacterium]
MNRITGIIFISVCLNISVQDIKTQDRSLVNTSESKHALLGSVDMDDVKWTKGFWAEHFRVCKDSMVPGMWKKLSDTIVSHSFRNFEIASGKEEGTHKGPPFSDGDFYKWFESAASVYSVTKDKELDRLMDEIIQVIVKSQREDGYIHTPVIIGQLNKRPGRKEFQERLDFETYNMGHLMTAACTHYRATGKTALLDAAVKATDFLYNYYKSSSPELARNAICPSHYMGVVEMYRTTGNPKYLELAENLINIRDLVKNGTDHNQDRIPFRQQKKAVGHAVRANYLYAGVADVYAETGDDSIMDALKLIWDDVVQKKIYITGACGALYDGVSPDGTSYNPAEIQQVHQAYGRDYQLPNITAHNESCANIGNILWNWRMLLVTGEARYADLMELTMYNSLLAGVSLDGNGYFYTNPLCVTDDITYTLRWSKQREEYISYCNCCPPNTIRTISEIHNYFYNISDKGVHINLYGGNALSTLLKDGSELQLTQLTGYPWDGDIKILIEKAPEKEFSVFLRIPGWCDKAEIWVNQSKSDLICVPGEYTEIRRKWVAGDEVELIIPMPVKLIEAHPLVEETRNQVAVKRGPVVYCLESEDIPETKSIFDIIIPSKIDLRPGMLKINSSEIMCLKGEALLSENPEWGSLLYRELPGDDPVPVNIRLIPYYAWGNRDHSEMTVWMPLSRGIHRQKEE